ncbi:MAG TPA: bifunctional DNA primase/polymerase [Actinocrinis sp.]|nr:bifunctional DNA primase/polymerase [Actinocrinis sp.]
MAQSAPNDLPGGGDVNVRVSDGGVRRVVGGVRADGVSAALALAERGFAVFPLRPGTKTPAVRRDWEGQATTDAARLREIVRPAANVGVACGPSRLLVLDLDVAKEPARPGEDPAADGDTHAHSPRHGAEALRTLAAGRELPPTLTVATPTGGRHLYYRAPRGFRLRNTVGRLGPLIDTRAEGGYVVGPGSVVDGRYYRVTADLPVAPLPSWLLRELRELNRPPQIPAAPAVPNSGATVVSSIGSGNANGGAGAYAAAALRNEVERVRTARVGTRNDTLNRAAFALGRLVGAGVLDRDLAVGELSDAGRQAGLPSREVVSTVSSGFGAGLARPRLPSLAPVPARPQPALAQPPPGPSESSGAAESFESSGPALGAQALSEDEAEIIDALRAVDRAYDAAALRAAGLSTNRDWRRLRALADALRDVRDAVMVTDEPGLEDDARAEGRAAGPVVTGDAAVRRAAALCHKISALARALAAGFPASGRRSPLGRALRVLDQAAQDAVRAAMT